MNNFTIDKAAKSETLISNSTILLNKQKTILKVMNIKSNEPKLTQKGLSKQLGFSDSTIKRYRDDIIMDSPYNRRKIQKEQNSNN